MLLAQYIRLISLSFHILSYIEKADCDIIEPEQNYSTQATSHPHLGNNFYKLSSAVLIVNNNSQSDKRDN